MEAAARRALPARARGHRAVLRRPSTRSCGTCRRCDTLLSFPQVLTVPFKAPSLLRWGFRTLGALLDDCVKDPLLRAVLSAQSGNHGLPPSRVSLPVHAAMAAHYDEGGFYPRGGAKSIPRAYIRELRRRGGALRMRTRVKRILVEGSRAAGVERRGRARRSAPPNIVCNADPAVTYGKLLAAEHCRRAALEREADGVLGGARVVFCAVDMDLERHGLRLGQLLVVPGHRRRRPLRAHGARSSPAPRSTGSSSRSRRSRIRGHAPHGHHTLEMFTFVPYGPFERWAASMPDARGARATSRSSSALGDEDPRGRRERRPAACAST